MPGLDFQRLRSEISMREVLDLLQFVCVNGRGDQLYGRLSLASNGRAQPMLFGRPQDGAFLLSPMRPGRQSVGALGGGHANNRSMTPPWSFVSGYPRSRLGSIGGKRQTDALCPTANRRRGHRYSVTSVVISRPIRLAIEQSTLVAAVGRAGFTRGRTPTTCGFRDKTPSMSPRSRTLALLAPATTSFMSLPCRIPA